MRFTAGAGASKGTGVEPRKRDKNGGAGHFPAGATIAISANSSWNIVNFRLGIIEALHSRGFEVAVVAPRDEHSSRLAELGVRFIPIEIDSAGLSITRDARLVFRYYRILRRLRPVAYLAYTPKPNVYGSIAARAVGAKVINNMTGLGTLFIKRGPLTALLKTLYRFCFRSSSTVFFQNSDDRNLFLRDRIVAAAQARLLPGSGIDVDHFKPASSDRAGEPFVFLFVGRLLWEKGIGEYVEAASIVRKQFPDARFRILGAMGVANRSAVPAAVVEQWRAEGIVEYLGATNDVRTALGQADCIVLPSYREGLPRALLEGSAMGKPLIATDVPGCRDVVVDGRTGFLCAARSAQALAAAMVRMLDTSPHRRQQMGGEGRRKVEKEFCETIVVDKYLEALGVD